MKLNKQQVRIINYHGNELMRTGSTDLIRKVKEKPSWSTDYEE